jgi:hypothetical protein
VMIAFMVVFWELVPLIFDGVQTRPKGRRMSYPFSCLVSPGGRHDQLF